MLCLKCLEGKEVVKDERYKKAGKKVWKGYRELDEGWKEEGLPTPIQVDLPLSKCSGRPGQVHPIHPNPVPDPSSRVRGFIERIL